MNSSPKNKVLDELRAKIGQQLKPTAPPAPPDAAPAAAQAERKQPVEHKSAPRRSRPAAHITPPAPARSGRGVQFYLDDADRKMITSLAVWFGSQDRRLSDSQVVKAAIRLALAQQNARLLQIADELRAADRRRIQKSDRKRAPKGE